MCLPSLQTERQNFEKIFFLMHMNTKYESEIFSFSYLLLSFEGEYLKRGSNQHVVLPVSNVQPPALLFVLQTQHNHSQLTSSRNIPLPLSTQVNWIWQFSQLTWTENKQNYIFCFNWEPYSLNQKATTVFAIF